MLAEQALEPFGRPGKAAASPADPEFAGSGVAEYPATRSPYALGVIDDGNAIHYAAVSRGTPVYAADGTEVGKVHEVVDNYREHILDGIVIETAAGELRFADAPEVGRTAERGVTLAIGAHEAAQLPPPEPGAEPSGPMSAVASCRGYSGAPGNGIRRFHGGVFVQRMKAEARVEFSLPARAESVPLVRHALAGLAEALEMDPSEIADLKTVVTEACTNVVVHAYRDETKAGPLEIDAWPDDDSLVVMVRDFGEGIRPLADVENRSLRLGLPLIAALTDSFEISGGPGQGTAVTMRLPLASNGFKPESVQAPEPVEETRINLPAGELLAPILSRVISMFAARADLSVDELSDAVLISDALSAQSPEEFPDGTARIVVSEEAGAFNVRVGPLAEGGGQRLLDGLRIPMLDASLESLADEVRVESDEDGELLLLRIGRAGRAPQS